MNNISSTQKETFIKIDKGDNGITTLTLNRPKSFNALSISLMSELQTALDEITSDPKVKVIILGGAGKAFCAGHDISEIINNPSEKTVRTLFSKCSRLMLTLTKMPQPVIARVHGVATAAGCQLVAQCDLAIASNEASFATSGIGIGLFCGTPSVAVTRNLPRKQAMELLLTGEFIPPEQALQYGLINKVVSSILLDEEIDNLALKIATKGSSFISKGKQLFYSQIEDGIEKAYEKATDFMVESVKTHATQKGLKAFIEKRDMPEWPER